jgi:Carboxypeptidase regulatory-like domain
MKQASRLILLVFGVAIHVCAQSTQGLISGHVTDTQEGAAIAAAEVFYSNLALSIFGSVRADDQGYYAIPLLSPGKYRIRVSKQNYQSQELRELELQVASSLDLNFRLRPSNDVWEEGRYKSLILPGTSAALSVYGPDLSSTHVLLLNTAGTKLGASEGGISAVVDPVQIQELPLAGRDIYTTVLLQPGVTSDTSTARGLGISINGQRPSSSNYLLDGAENNNYLTTGPLTPVAPESVQEYRISSNNFSAEFGRTSGFLANAVTRSGGNQWHGLTYFYIKHDALNAADFQSNLNGEAKSPLREAQPGFYLGGPLLSNRLFFSTSFEYYRFRGRLAPETIVLPTAQLLDVTGPNSQARQLLEKYPAPFLAGSAGPTVTARMSPTSSLDRYFGTTRLDFISRGGAHRVMARLAITNYNQPDAGWSPYHAFLTPLIQTSTGFVVNVTSSVRPNLTNEARLGWSSIDIRYDQAHPEIPTLDAGALVLPGTRSFFSLNDQNSVWQMLDDLVWSTGRHQVKLGGGVFQRRLANYLKTDANGYFQFPDVQSVASDTPNLLVAPVSRQQLFGSQAGDLNLQVPNYDRLYRSADFFGFAQDSFKVTPRFTVNYGLRYDYFGAPVNSGPVKDGILQLGVGNSLADRIGSGSIMFPQNGAQQIYSSDPYDWSLRSGFAYLVDSKATLLLLGGYGVFYDRPYDNLWENIRNNSVVLTLQQLSAPVNYLAPLPSQLQKFTHLSIAAIDNTQFIHDTLYQPGLRNGYAQSYYISLQKHVSESLTIQLSSLGSLGRRLVTTDLLNRALTVPPGTQSNNLLGYSNASLPPLSYRSNQGDSDYNAFTGVVRFRSSRGQLQAAYTWSHSIDNQSEPLTGEFDFTDLNRGGAGLNGIAGFSRQFDSRVDRGNSDFDQRHNLVFYSTWEVPAWQSRRRAGMLFRDWRISQLAAVRSGLPYSVLAPATFSFTGQSIINNRADIVNRNQIYTDQPIAGGRQLLNLAAFQQPASGTLGNSGRNAFYGPGLFNIDLSINRSISLPKLREGARLVVRADAFNFLNHANLNNPVADLSSPDNFGAAYFGRKEQNRGFPLVTPLRETARQIQILFRVEF